MIALLRRYLRPYVRPLLLVVGLLVAQAIATLYLPELNAEIINNGVTKGDTGYILSTGGVMLVISGLVVVCAIIAVYWGSKTGMAFGRDVRSAIFRTVQGFSQAELNRFGTASLITRNTNDVQQVQMVVLMGLNMMIIAPILAIGGVIMALRQDVPLAGILVVILPIMAFIVGSLMVRALPLFQAVQRKVDRVNQVTREALSGIRVIRAFVRTRHEEERFDVANRDLTATSLQVNRLFALMIPSLMLVFNLSSVAILWFGSLRVDSGEMPIGNLIAFLQYVMQILMAVMMAVFMFVMVPRAVVSAGRIQEVLRTDPSIGDPDVATTPPAGVGRLGFTDVEFRYPGAEDPVLRGITFTVEPGRTTAIVGSTGSGKSTLINLLVPGAQAQVGEISQALNSGRHTTTTTRWYWIDAERTTALIDSPGFQEFGLRQIGAAELAGLMPDLREHSRACRFYNCTHRHEPDCGVRAALERGVIDASRYRIYGELFAELS